MDLLVEHIVTNKLNPELEEVGLILRISEVFLISWASSDKSETIILPTILNLNNITF